MKRFLPLLLLPTLALADGTWTKTALSQQAVDLVSLADGNLARSPRTTLTLAGNSPANSDKAWQSPAELIVNGLFDTNTSQSDEGHLYPIRTGATVTFVRSCSVFVSRMLRSRYVMLPIVRACTSMIAAFVGSESVIVP